MDDEKRGAQVFYRLVTPCVMNFFQCVASVREKSTRVEERQPVRFLSCTFTVLAKCRISVEWPNHEWRV